MIEAEKTEDKQKAFEASSATAATMILAIILSAFDRLEVPLPDSISSNLDGFNITLTGTRHIQTHLITQSVISHIELRLLGYFLTQH